MSSSPRSDSRGQRGFTLVELMVTVSLVAVIVSLGVPSFQGFLERQAVLSQTEMFTSSVRYTRSEAIRSGRFVTMCRSTDPGATSPACVAGSVNDWSSGWVIFEDVNRNSVIDANETVLRVVQPESVKREITGGAVGSLTFGAMGVSTNAASSFVVRPRSAAYNADMRTICVSKPGRVRVVLGQTC